MKLVSLAGAAALLVAIAGGWGCQSYERRPLDLETHRREWLERTPASPEVAEFATKLAAEEAAAPVAFDPADGLMLPEAEIVALAFNADLRVARLKAGVARANAENAGLWDDPMLGANFNRFIQSTQYPWKAMVTVGFTLPISGRLEIEKKRAGAEHAAEILRVYQQEWGTRVELRTAWAKWTAAGQRVAVMKEFIARLEQIVGIVEALERAGELPRVEASMFRVELASRRTELRRMTGEEAEGLLEIKRLMGMSPLAELTLLPGPGFKEERVSIDSLREQLPRRSPMLAVATAEYEVAERALELEIRKQYPDLTIGPGYGREDGMDELLLDLEIPLPLLNRNRQAIAMARAEREVSRAAYEAGYEKVVAELDAAGVRYAAACDQRGAIESDIVPLVDRQYVEVRRVAELGEVNTLLLLDSLMRQQEAKLKLIDARQSEWAAAIEIDGIAGPVPAAEVRP